jgi:hypothetical protein
MNAVYKNFKPQGGDLTCTAKEVYANSAEVLQGPTACERGEPIIVNVTASIHFNAGRYDPAIYTATSSCTGGDANNNRDFSQGVVVQADPVKGNDAPIIDTCYDVPGNDYDLTFYEFQKNMQLPCNE